MKMMIVKTPWNFGGVMLLPLLVDDVAFVDDKSDFLILFLFLRISMCCILILIDIRIDRMLVENGPI
jgi:hypothetical protein